MLLLPGGAGLRRSARLCSLRGLPGLRVVVVGRLQRQRRWQTGRSGEGDQKDGQQGDPKVPKGERKTAEGESQTDGGQGDKADSPGDAVGVRRGAQELKERLQKLRDVQRRFDMDSPMEVQMRMGKSGKKQEDLAPRYRDTAPLTTQRKKFKEEIARLEQIPGVNILRGPAGEIRMIDVPVEIMNKAEIDHRLRVEHRVKVATRSTLGLVCLLVAAVVWMAWKLTSHDAGPPPDEPIGAKVFFEIYQEEERIGTVVLGLYTERCPMTCENFYRLVVGDNPEGHSYRGCDVFQIFPHIGIVSGDYVKNTGSAARPILPYFPGKRWFPDEMAGKDLPFFRGALCSSGPLFAQKDGHNDSTFMITKAGTPKHNHAFVIFGEVLSGMPVIDFVARVHNQGGRPIRRVWIKRCGQYTHTLDERQRADTPGPAQFRLDNLRK
eukprot:Hpha_TRINITY_DN19020_c0_g1::TRINITY_DN19020_c0_g1_i1::g.138252::m.138252